jgi:hypothetical protein
MKRMMPVESPDSFFEKSLKVLRNASPLGVTFQAYLESAGYSSELAREAHNFCGMKAKGDWRGPIYEKLSDEDEGGEKKVKRWSPFRSYKTTEEFLRDLDRKVMKPNYALCVSLEGRYSFWIYFAGLVEGHWATDREYFEKLVDVAVGQMPKLTAFREGWRSKLHLSFQWAHRSGKLTPEQERHIIKRLEEV